MKESQERMPSQPPRPRVMRRVGQLAGRSVHTVEQMGEQFATATIVRSGS